MNDLREKLWSIFGVGRRGEGNDEEGMIILI